MSRHRRGFTLIELLAALSISGLVMLGGVILVDQVTDSSARIVRSGLIAAHDGNGPRLLRQLMFDARITADSLDRFRGDERSAEFSTMCRRPGGWLEACRAAVGIDWRKDTSVVMALLSTGENLELARRPGTVELRYLDAIATDSTWLRQWAMSIALPIAIGIISGNDTSVFSLGTRR
jgi:prepilin-type N-terminal cleavage/methylation domain-containing protein